MATVHSSRLAPLAALAMGLACGRDAAKLPSAPDMPAAQASLVAADDVPRFSDWSEPTNLGTVVNTRFADFDPFISKDGLSLYFSAGAGRGGEGGRDIWVTTREGAEDPWEIPVSLGAPVNSASHDSKPTLSHDGHRLYFTSNRGGNFDVYVSRRRNARDNFGWGPPVNLGAGVNTAFSEDSAVTLLDDEATGQTILFFGSDRPTGLQGVREFNIYSSMLQPDGTFGDAMLVDRLNTGAADTDPAIRRDGLEIFFASTRPGGRGGFDLWAATRATTTDRWSALVNLGHVNSPPRPQGPEESNDFRPVLSFDGTTLYFGSPLREGNVGLIMVDLWMTTRSRLRGPD